MSLLKITAEITALLHIMRQVAELPQNLRGFQRSVHDLAEMGRSAREHPQAGGSTLAGILHRLRDAWHGIAPAEEAGAGRTLPSRPQQPGHAGPRTARDEEAENRGGQRLVDQTAQQAEVAGAGRGPSRGGAATGAVPGAGRTVLPAPPARGSGAAGVGGGAGGGVPVVPPSGGMPPGGGAVPPGGGPPTPGLVTPHVVGPPPVGPGGGAAGAAAGLAGMMGGPAGALVTGLLVAGPAIISFGKALIDTIRAVREFAKAFNEHARSMAKYSGPIAQASATQDVERYRMDFERSQAAGPWAAAAINSRTDLENVRQPIQQLGDKLGAAITVSTNRIEEVLTEQLNQLLLIRPINSLLSWIAQKAGMSTAMSPALFDAVIRGYGEATPQMGANGRPADPAGGMRGVSPRAPGVSPRGPGAPAVPGAPAQTIPFGSPPQAQADLPRPPQQKLETNAEAEADSTPPPLLPNGFGLGFGLGAALGAKIFGGGKK